MSIIHYNATNRANLTADNVPQIPPLEVELSLGGNLPYS